MKKTTEDAWPKECVRRRFRGQVDRATEAYERMMSGKARFRVVLVIDAKS